MGAGAAIEAAIGLGPLARYPRRVVDQWLAQAVRIETPPGTSIYQENDEPQVGLVVEGIIRLYMTAPDGRQVTVRYARPGQLIGVPALIGGPAPVSASMLTRSVVLMLPVGALRSTAHEHAEVAWLFAEEVCRRLYDSLEGLAGNAFGTLTERVCRHLLDVASPGPTPDTLTAEVTQQDLANAVGSSRVPVARILAELRTEGLIATHSGHIELTDPLAVHERAWARE